MIDNNDSALPEALSNYLSYNTNKNSFNFLILGGEGIITNNQCKLLSQSLNAESMTSSQAGERLLNIINDKRKANGLSLLSSDSDLNRVAQLKAKDICVNNDVSYYSDKYGSVEDLLKSNNISHQTVHCDIIGTNDPSAVSESLIDSVNANTKVFNPAINYVGIGVIDNSIYGKIYTIIYVQK